MVTYSLDSAGGGDSQRVFVYACLWTLVPTACQNLGASLQVLVACGVLGGVPMQWNSLWHARSLI